MNETTVQNLIRELAGLLLVPIDDIELVSVGDHRIFNIRTPDSKRIIGPQGDHLYALNSILRRLLERVDPESKGTHVMIDVNGYQLSHIRDIEQKARLLADRVRTFRSSAEMTPMTAYERMIIHSLFTNDPDITTESDGTGKMRHIVLRYKG